MIPYTWQFDLFQDDFTQENSPLHLLQAKRAGDTHMITCPHQGLPATGWRACVKVEHWQYFLYIV